jgi:hypothetical protein
MTAHNETSAQPTSLKIDLDRNYHWAWAERARAMLPAPTDRETFDLCLLGGARLEPARTLAYLEETFAFTADEVVDRAQWQALIAYAEQHAQAPAPASFTDFALAVEDDLYQRSAQVSDGVIVDMLDTSDGVAQTSFDFTIGEVFFWFGLEEEVSSIRYEHDGESSCASLVVSGPNWSKNFELHVAADRVRDGLARHHFETVTEGEDSVIAHLNASSDEHCEALSALAQTHPGADLWQLERLCAPATAITTAAGDARSV